MAPAVWSDVRERQVTVRDARGRALRNQIEDRASALYEAASRTEATERLEVAEEKAFDTYMLLPSELSLSAWVRVRKALRELKRT